MGSDETMESTCYLRLSPRVKKGRVTGFRVTHVTQGRPQAADGPGTRMVKLTVRVPKDAFDAIEATMDVPAEFLEAPVTVAPTEGVEV